MNSRKRNYIVPVFVAVLVVAFAVILYELTWGKSHKPKTLRERGKEVVMEYLKEKYNEEFCIYDSHSPAFMQTEVVYDVTPLTGKYKNVDFEVSCDEKNPTVKSCRDSYTPYLFQEPYAEYCRGIVGKQIKDFAIFARISGMYDYSITGKERGADMLPVAQAYIDIIVFDTEDSIDKYKKIKDEIFNEIHDMHGNCGVYIRCLKDDKFLDSTINTREEYEEKIKSTYDDKDLYKWIV